MLEFARTMMGKQFFDSTVPRLVKALERIADNLEHKEDDKVQFARLVCEFNGIVDQRESTVMLCKSMDLSPSQLGDLLRRAERVFEDAKRRGPV